MFINVLFLFSSEDGFYNEYYASALIRDREDSSSRKSFRVFLFVQIPKFFSLMERYFS